MIYASLKTIPAWSNRFTVPTYMFFALATGSSLLSVISVIFGRFQAGAGNFQSLLTVLLIFLVIVLKWQYWRWLRRSKGKYTMGQATGLGDDVRQWEVPHTAENFIMKEMGYQVARNHALRLQRLCTLLLDIGFGLTLFAPYYAWLTFLVAPILLLAAWVERWLFFAQAEHVVGLFYGQARV
jgi:DMSO reductase anchor subunit